MKTCFAFLFAAFFIGASLAQEHTQSPPNQKQDGLQGWYPQQSGVTGTLNHVFFKNRDSGWATAGYTFTIATTDGGNTWQKYSDSIAVLGFIGSFGYGYTIRGTGWVATTTNNGKTWQNDSVRDHGMNAAYFCSSSRGFATWGYDIAETNDGGKTWTHVTSPIQTTSNFICFDSLNIFAGGDDHDNNPPYSPIAGLALSNNGGKDWQKLVPKLSSGLNDVVALDSMTLVETGGDIFRSTNRGNSWKEMTIRPSIPNNLVLRAVAVTEGHNLIAVGSRGVILRSIDSGSTWIEQNSTTTLELDDVTFIDTITGWAVGELGTILHTTNAGYSWVIPNSSIDSLNVQVDPNPAISTLNFAFNLPLSQHVTITILDLSGRQVLMPRSNQIEPQGANTILLNISSLPSSTYLYRISTEKFQSSGKFIVSH